MKINIAKFQLLEICNLHFDVYSPLKKFVSKKEFLNIANLCKYNNNFFPLPIYFNINQNIYNKLDKQKIEIFYKKTLVCNFTNYKKYKISINTKTKIFPKIFKTKDIEHPGVKKFFEESQFYIDSKIENFNIEILKKITFVKPVDVKKLINKNSLSQIAGFHTRNVPHKGHEWIHNEAIKKCKALLIQPLIGQYRKNEYKEKIIIKTNKKLIDKIYKNKKVLFAILNTYPRYAGPKEAILHAIVRKNYGCTHFIVGRDHAGVGDYYKKYESQKFCKQNEKKIGIKIIAIKEPVLCQPCKRIVREKCDQCEISNIKKISGTIIRSLILKKQKIPKNLMRSIISNMLSSNSLIK